MMPRVGILNRPPQEADTELSFNPVVRDTKRQNRDEAPHSLQHGITYHPAYFPMNRPRENRSRSPRRPLGYLPNHPSHR
jgi:hypothetical protein